jgi:hypothetical protein
VQAVAGPPTALGAPQVVARSALSGRYFVTSPAARIVLDPFGAATVFGVVPRQSQDTIVPVLVTADGAA